MRITIDRSLSVLLILIFLLTVSSCSGPSAIDANRIDRAGSMIDTRPDAALALLDSIDRNPLGKGKAYVKYLIGKGNLNMLNYPEATRNFLLAEKLAEENGTDSVLILACRGLMDLSDSIYDINEKVRYAIILSNIYYKNDDYDNMYKILSEFEYYYDVNIPINKYGEELEYTASLLLANDTVMEFHSCSDSMQPRAERIYKAICNAVNINSLSNYIHIDGLNSFNPQELINKIISDDGWRTEIVNDSIDINPIRAHLITTELWELGHHDLARNFMLYYRHHYSDKIINQRMDKELGGLNAYVAFRMNDRRKREFRSTFQTDVREAAIRFQYEEVAMGKQTIRFQRILLASVIALSLTIIAIIGLYTRSVTTRRRQREEQNMLSAAELRTSLHGLEEENLSILSHLCDTYYESYSKQSDKSKTARETMSTIRNMASSPNFIRRLENYLDRTEEGVMSLLRSELPDLKDNDTNLFLFNALGLSIPSICIMTGERREVIYNRRVRLRAKIQDSDAPHKDVFLKYLR